jgi:hypothetical protein
MDYGSRVDTIVRPPEAPPELPVQTGTRRRRWPRRLAIVAIIVVAATLVSGLVWVTNVEPLGRGHMSTPVRDPSVRSSSRFVQAFGVSGLVNTVRVAPGSTFRYDVTISNDGSLPVTITEIGTPEGGDISRRVIAVAYDHYPGGTPRATVPFSPFRLEPGSDAFIEMEVRLSDDTCLDRGGYYLWDSEPVTYKILGITRHSDVGTGTEIRVKSTEGPTPGC